MDYIYNLRVLRHKFQQKHDSDTTFWGEGEAVLHKPIEELKENKIIRKLQTQRKMQPRKKKSTILKFVTFT